jgi:glutathione S-transferase
MMEYMDNLTLYELAGADPENRFSPHCWKVRFALAHKGIGVRRVAWRFTEKEAIAFSGQTRVPVLVHDQTVISDSWNIAVYLEETFRDRRSLFGAPEAVPLTKFINSWADTALIMALLRVILLDVYACVDDRDREYFRSSREARLGMTLEEAAADREKHVAEFRRALQPLRPVLERQEFLAGDQPAYADYCVLGMFMWARCTSEVALLEPSDPVFRWRERLYQDFEGLS